MNLRLDVEFQFAKSDVLKDPSMELGKIHGLGYGGNCGGMRKAIDGGILGGRNVTFGAILHEEALQKAGGQAPA